MTLISKPSSAAGSHELEYVRVALSLAEFPRSRIEADMRKIERLPELMRSCLDNVMS